MLNRNRVIGLVLVAVLLLAAAPAVLGAFSPEVFAIDQPVIDDTVNITRATVGEAGWVVVHADEDGAPGPVLGYTALPSGINANVKVTLDPSGVTDTLYAMLHVDAGESGVFEPEGDDVPVERNGQPVVKSFAATGTQATVVKVLAEDGRFSTLVEAVEAAGLTDALRKEPEVTVFAPTDDAFAALDPDALDALLADPAQLSSVLLYHVAPGVLMAADIADGEVETLNGAPLTLAVADGAVTVNDVPVAEADLAGSNGVIHVIDSVLLPPVEEPAAEDAAADAAAGDTMPASLVDVVTGDETLSTLGEAVAAAGLVDALGEPGPYTLFAPNNDAFAALPADELDALLADPEALAAVLQYHVVEGALPSSDIADGLSVPTLGGQPLTFAVKADGVYVGDAKVLTADTLTGNGIVHVIDKVLLPPADAEGAAAETPAATEEATEAATEEAAAEAAGAGKTIAEVAAEAGDFTTLLAAVDAAGLGETLAGAGPLTLFAPTDAAFANLPAGALDALLADPEALKEVLLYHVVPAKLTAEQLPAEGIATSAQGSLLVFAIHPDGVSVNSTPVVQADIEADNGIIHVIDSVLLPPQKGGAAATEAATTEATEVATEEAAATTEATEEATEEAAAAVATPEPTAVPTVVPTATPAPTATAKPTNTAAPTATNTPEPTNTPAPTATNTPEPTNTPAPTATNTPKPTNTPAPTATNTPAPTNTPLPTATNTLAPTSTPLPTNTPAPTATLAPTSTPLPPPTSTRMPTSTPLPANTPAETATEAATEAATVEASAAVTTEESSEAVAVITLEMTPEATAEMTEEATAEATEEMTAAATEAAVEEATPEATTEMTAEATVEATEEATVAATEEAVVEATTEATEEATPAADVTETPAEMPTSGGELSGGSLTLAVVAGVLAALMGGAYVTRRRAA